MIKLENVRKHYDHLDLNVNMEVKPNTITCLVGANASGKTTTFKAILNLINYEGKITCLGKDVKDFTNKDKEDLGVVFVDSGFNKMFKIKSIMNILETCYPKFDKKYFLEMCNKFNLPLNKKLSTFSTGMIAKLKIVIATSHDAKLLILDEPTAGLDVISRDEILEILRDYMLVEGRSILISSHIAVDLESLADDLYFLDNGEIKLHETIDNLLNNYAVIKVTDEEYETLDKEYILKTKKEEYGKRLLTKEKQYYLDNYPNIVIEKSGIDDLIYLMIKGE